MFHTILIANRGEIACRIIATTRRMGIKSVIVYSHADRFSTAVLSADQALCIGNSPAEDSYLNVAAIVAAAIASGAQAIHPGYGFLSENPALASACEDANLVFIGPSKTALTIMGSKQRAKKHLEEYNIPMIPGYHGQDQSDHILLDAAQNIGFPLMLKAAAGGGGKGMRAVYSQDEWPTALQATRREALAYFSDSTLLIEKKISGARHLEVQIMADHHDNVVHIFERDCSLQRRHQKLIEEAPGPNISNALHELLTTTAVNVAKSIQYYGAGTVEFLVDAAEQIYFMEMNTRLQVEHPTTEMISQLDLVEWQILIAAKEKLPRTQKNIQQHGHAIECRLYAEDPDHAFLPSMGEIHALVTPASNMYLRLESGISAGDTITPYYDAMLGKLIAWGETRALAITRLQKALSQYHLVGLKTNRDYILEILNNPEFIAGTFNNDFLTTITPSSNNQDTEIAVSMAACLDYIKLTHNPDPLHANTIGFQLHNKLTWSNNYLVDDTLHTVHLTPISSSVVEITSINSNIWSIHNDGCNLAIDNGLTTYKAWVMEQSETYCIDTGRCMVNVQRIYSQTTALAIKHLGSEVFSPMPGTVVAVLYKNGEHVQQGDRLMILEAMKMEYTLYAPCSGHIEHIFYPVGSQVNEGIELMRIKEDDRAS